MLTQHLNVMLSEAKASEKSHYTGPFYRQDDKFAKKMSRGATATLLLLFI